MDIEKGESLRKYPVFVTKSQVFEITDYSFVKNMSTMSCIQSDTFIVGGYEWAIEFYPQGDMCANSESVAVMVRLMNPTKDVKAVWNHRLRDWNTSGWSTGTPTSFEVKTFSPSGTIVHGQSDFISRSKLEASSYLNHDMLMIKTTLWVVKD